MIKMPGQEKYALGRCNVQWNDEYEFVFYTDPIFDGTYEFLDAEVEENEKFIYILNAGENKYVANTSTGKLFASGNSIIGHEKDNLGGCCLITEKGRFLLTVAEGYPSFGVDFYYRAQFSNLLETFMYSHNGKCGVYMKTLDTSRSVSAVQKFIFKEIIPAEYDKIRFIYGDGASHFLVLKNDQWKILDMQGCERYMTALRGKYLLNDKYGNLSQSNVTVSYVPKVISISADCEDHGKSYFKTPYTYVGDEAIGIIHLQESDKYTRFFDSLSDGGF